MTELLRRVVEEVEQLSPERQDAIAEAMRREIEEQEWDALLATPESQRLLQQLATEALAEDAAGKTRESGESW